jgi:hypothetical protein
MKMILINPASLNFKKIKKALSILYYYPSTWLAKQKLQHLDTTAV